MDPRLLRYYNRELQYIREMGGEFAREFPKIAGRLGLEEFECADPYVERLLESFAFLTARVQLKVDAEFPRFTQHLLEVVYPHYLAPTPSIAVVQMQPSKSEGALASGFKVPRGSALRSQIGKGEQTACDYRTAHDVTLWPLELTRADYTGYLADLGVSRMPTGKTARAALRLRLKATAGLSLRDLALDRLPLFIRSNDELAVRLYEQLMANAVGVMVRPSGAAAGEGSFTEELPAALGFSDDEALLPYGPRSFQGYRLLQEYFACPARFLFAELGDLKGAVRRCSQPEIEIVVFFDRLDSSLENAVSTAQLALYATPAVNLFPRRADRIHLADWTHEYQVVPDRTRPLDFEVYAVNEVVGHGTSGDQQQSFVPLYATNVRSGGDESAAYFTVHRQPRMLSSKQQSRGPRSSYTGSEVFVALVDGQEGPYRTNMRQLALGILATNRDLPLHIPIGQGRTDFTLESGAPVESIRCVSGPTPPRASHAHGDTTWRLISHLALNYLSLVGEGANANGAMREMLRLYADLSDASTAKQIDGVAGTSSKPVTRRLPIDGPISFGRGMEITLTLDESSFQGSGAYLLGAVLERFFAKYVSINSFTETVLRTVQRGELRRWPPTIGLRHTI